ncbi:MAG: diadenylate cyclase CdaA [Clostridia bacterium]|nr:diadenylate cyclase CdaA [Clostridia bacterium]
MEQVFDYLSKFIQLLKITDIIDVAIVAILVYQLLKMIRETRALQLVKGIAILFLLVPISAWMNLTAVNYILKNVMQIGLFSIVVIFQPELRSLLERVGRSKVGKLIDFASPQMEESKIQQLIDEIVTATVNLSTSKTGALIVFERETKLGDIVKSGAVLNADVSSSLLENIFVPNTPLHDGAVIIRGDKIHTAACVLPLTSNTNLSRELGTRHRAALGMSEVSDAMVVVVSEETGKISIALNGSLTRNLNGDTLKKALERALTPKTSSSELNKIKFWKGVSK